MNALGEFIRAQRQLANLSLREMAAMTSVSNANLSQVERGLHQPSLKVLHSIAAALQLSTEQLLAQAGWVSGAREAAAGNGTEEAIRTDPRLTPEHARGAAGRVPQLRRSRMIGRAVRTSRWDRRHTHCD
jgi:transcriptional regulator with XRE-family HTH domain